MCLLYKVMIDLQIRLLLSHTNIAKGKEKTLGRAAVCMGFMCPWGLGLSRVDLYACLFSELCRGECWAFFSPLVHMLLKISRSQRDVSLEARQKIQKNSRAY